MITEYDITTYFSGNTYTATVMISFYNNKYLKKNFLNALGMHCIAFFFCYERDCVHFENKESRTGERIDFFTTAMVMGMRYFSKGIYQTLVHLLFKFKVSNGTKPF